MQDALVVLRRGAEHDKFDTCSFYSLLRKVEQGSTDTLTSMARNYIELLDFKIRSSVRHDGTGSLRLFLVSEQVTQNLAVLLCQKDSISLDVAAVILAVAISAVLFFPLCGHGDQLFKQFVIQFRFVYVHTPHLTLIVAIISRFITHCKLANRIFLRYTCYN